MITTKRNASPVENKKSILMFSKQAEHPMKSSKIESKEVIPEPKKNAKDNLRTLGKL